MYFFFFGFEIWKVQISMQKFDSTKPNQLRNLDEGEPRHMKMGDAAESAYQACHKLPADCPPTASGAILWRGRGCSCT